MTITALYPAVALATVVNAFFVWFAWRGNKAEIAAGEPPWWLILGMLVYLGSMSAFYYFKKDAVLDSYFDLFMTALIGQAFGTACMFGIGQLLRSQGKAIGDRIAAVVAVAFFLFLFLADFFI